MTYATGFNATEGPLVIDRAGRTLGGGEFGPVRPDESPVRGHVAAGRVVVAERPPEAAVEDLDPGAVAAFDRTAEANEGPSPEPEPEPAAEALPVEDQPATTEEG